jgi:hypothetical protein
LKDSLKFPIFLNNSKEKDHGENSGNQQESGEAWENFDGTVQKDKKDVQVIRFATNP